MLERLTIAVAAAVLLCGCDKILGKEDTSAPASKPEPPVKTQATVESAPPKTSIPIKPPASVAGGAEAPPAAAPTAQGYDLSAIKPVADNCQSAKVLIATAPLSVGPEYQWPWAKQAMLANQQFRTVAGAATTPGTVAFKTFHYNGNFALVAFCGDGTTCNQLAAMHKTVVRTSNPQVFCGDIPGIEKDSPVFSPIVINQTSPKDSLPAENDTIGLCARLSACMIATDRAVPGNPGMECQKAPSKFKTACARRYPCAEVMACIGQ